MSETAPGWYADPDAPGYVRWWDGQRWGDMRMPEGMQPSAPSRTALGFEIAGNVGKLILLLLLLGFFVLVLWLVFG